MNKIPMFWNVWIIGLTLTVIIGLVIILHFTRKMKGDGEPDKTTGHVFDGIEEYNKPLPKWWLYLFYGTIIYAFLYIGYYGYANIEGVAKWSSAGQLAQEQEEYEAKFGAVFTEFNNTPLAELANNKQAQAMGEQIFRNNCVICHGVNKEGQSAYGFPNLTDNDWLHGSSAQQIEKTIQEGRRGAMPAHKESLTNTQLKEVTEYVLSLSQNDQKPKADMVIAGKEVFNSTCAVCHGEDGKGKHDFGSANLTDDIWLFNNPNLELREDVYFTVKNGRKSQMPAWGKIIGEKKAHLAAAYIYAESLK
ncbi:MAG: cytochrome-c oxidase, cbb3-type subunit III [Saccharospirillaceae bacterium]|nr:cytochrome-c oxidase, cbb3-type subunit III [Pseudomonadales bacterium]NRB78236.1 cytochrome-c oxidase, cbb3-type subunit III [Saccharospirillaceae bacterium]